MTVSSIKEHKSSSLKKLKEWLESNRISEVECIFPDIAGSSKGKILPVNRFVKSVEEQSLKLADSVFGQTVSGKWVYESEVIDYVEEDLFMIPDTHEAKDIRIYKCIEFPLKWKFHKILINNISAVDTNIIKHNNKYWLFTNKDSSSIGDHSSELHIFYSDHFDSDNWKSHPKNPVIFNSCKARNGGLLRDKNNIYRPYQIQGWDLYGESMGVAKIKILTANVPKLIFFGIWMSYCLEKWSRIRFFQKSI